MRYLPLRDTLVGRWGLGDPSGILDPYIDTNARAWYGSRWVWDPFTVQRARLGPKCVHIGPDSLQRDVNLDLLSVPRFYVQ